MSESIQELMARLRKVYLAEAPARIAELRDALAEFIDGREPTGPSLSTRFHRLSGTAGTYGFDQVSAVCRATEQWLATSPHPTEETRARIAAAIDEVERLFAEAPGSEP